MDNRRLGDGFVNPFLLRLSRLTQLGESDLEMLDGACGTRREVRAKADFVLEEDRLDRLHVLLEGWACRFKLLPDGRRQITALLVCQSAL